MKATFNFINSKAEIIKSTIYSASHLSLWLKILNHFEEYISSHPMKYQVTLTLSSYLIKTSVYKCCLIVMNYNTVDS